MLVACHAGNRAARAPVSRSGLRDRPSAVEQLQGRPLSRRARCVTNGKPRRAAAGPEQAVI
eukprot:6141264-Prymnesium_polylepis.2